MSALHVSQVATFERGARARRDVAQRRVDQVTARQAGDGGELGVAVVEPSYARPDKRRRASPTAASSDFERDATRSKAGSMRTRGGDMPIWVTSSKWRRRTIRTCVRWAEVSRRANGHLDAVLGVVTPQAMCPQRRRAGQRQPERAAAAALQARSQPRQRAGVRDVHTRMDPGPLPTADHPLDVRIAATETSDLGARHDALLPTHQSANLPIVHEEHRLAGTASARPTRTPLWTGAWISGGSPAPDAGDPPLSGLHPRHVHPAMSGMSSRCSTDVRRVLGEPLLAEPLQAVPAVHPARGPAQHLLGQVEAATSG